MNTSTPLKWRHFQAKIILLCIRWYLHYPLSYRDLQEILLERGLHVEHTTIYCWVQYYAPELEKRGLPHLNATNGSWRVDETYVKVKKVWIYLYCAVDSQGKPLEFLFSPRRDAEAAKRFFAKALAAPHISPPRVITVDTNAAYPKAIKELKVEGIMPDACELRQSKYLNNHVEQDHRFIKRLVEQGIGFFSSETAWPHPCRGYETMNMLRKGRVRGVEKGDSRKQMACIASLFGVAV